MKRANCIVVYEEGKDKDDFGYFRILNLTVITKDGETVPLITYDPDKPDKNNLYKFYSWHHLYEDVLTWLRNNGFYVQSWQNFGRIWYNIQFIDSAEPWDIKHYSHSWH